MDLHQPRGYNGRRLVQLDDETIQIYMESYVAKLFPLEIRRRRVMMLLHNRNLNNGFDRRPSVGSSRRTPQAYGDATILSGKVPTLNVEDMKQLSAALSRLKKNVMPVVITGIAPKQTGIMVFVAASLANVETKTQAGYAMGAYDKIKLQDGLASPLSLLQ